MAWGLGGSSGIETTADLGSRLGHEAVERVVRLAEEHCEAERRRIEAVNQAEILVRKADLSLLLEQERDLREQIRLSPPLSDLRDLKRRRWYSWSIAVFISVAGFFFSLLAFDPFRLGWKSYLYCIGIALVVPFSVEKVLESWGNQRLVRFLAATALGAGLTSLFFLALIRGDVLSQTIESESPAVILGHEQSISADEKPSFYADTTPRLRLVMALLALAMEIGAGLALHDALRLGAATAGDRARLNQELARVHERMLARIYNISRFQNEPEVFASRFWRDFYRAMLSGTIRSALTKLSVIALALFLGSSTAVYAGENLSVVVVVDLTKSVATTGHDEETAFDRNLDSVTELLARLPAGSRITVVGITDNSFAQPYVLLSAQVSEDEGYFKERLGAARRQMVRAWQERRAHLRPWFAGSDVLGALFVAAQLFEQAPAGRKVLVVLSDMRHQALGIDLERGAVTSAPSALAKVHHERLVADLRGVEVYALGAEVPGRGIAYWQSLRDFWTEYFRSSGASLRSYSLTRELPRLTGDEVRRQP